MSDVRRKQAHGSEDFRFVNQNHHTSCFAINGQEDLTLFVQRHPPDPYTIPVETQTFLKVKDASISEGNILNLCRTARVYFNSDRLAASRRKLKKRFEDVSSPRRVKHTEKKLIPLEGFESKVRRSRPKRFSESAEEDDEVGPEDQYDLNPHPVLPEINSKRKSRQDYSGYPQSRRRHLTQTRGSSKTSSLKHSSEKGDTRRSGYHTGAYSRNGSRDEKRSNHSDNDYTDDE